MSTENNKKENQKETISEVDIVCEMKKASLRNIATDLNVSAGDDIDRARENVAAILSITDGSDENTPLGYLNKRAEWTKGEIETRKDSSYTIVGPCDQILHALSKEIEAYLES